MTALCPLATETTTRRNLAVSAVLALAGELTEEERAEVRLALASDADPSASEVSP